MGNPVTPAQRLAAVQAQMEQIITCPLCGSEHFTESTFNKYSSNVYGAQAGADLRVASTMPQTIRVCLCGWPYNPNLSGFTSARSMRGMETEGFSRSLQNAQTYLKTAGAKPNLDAITREMVTTSDLNAVKDLITSLTEQLTAMQDALDAETEELGGNEAEAEGVPAEPTSA